MIISFSTNTIDHSLFVVFFPLSTIHQVHGISVFDNLEGVSFYHAMKVTRTNFVQKGVIVELVQVFRYLYVYSNVVRARDLIPRPSLCMRFKF